MDGATQTRQPRYRSYRRSPWIARQFASVSLALRVASGNVCQCCQRRYFSPSSLQTAHLLAERHAFDLAGRTGQYKALFDLRNCVALCKLCHAAFDLRCGVRYGISARRRTQLEHWYTQHEAAFRRFGLARMRYAATLVHVQEMDGGNGNGRGDVTAGNVQADVTSRAPV